MQGVGWQPPPVTANAHKSRARTPIRVTTKHTEQMYNLCHLQFIYSLLFCTHYSSILLFYIHCSTTYIYCSRFIVLDLLLYIVLYLLFYIYLYLHLFVSIYSPITYYALIIYSIFIYSIFIYLILSLLFHIYALILLTYSSIFILLYLFFYIYSSIFILLYLFIILTCYISYISAMYIFQ